MRPAVPVPITYCRSMPRSQAWLRTAGDAIGLSPTARVILSLPLAAARAGAGLGAGAGGALTGATAGTGAGAAAALGAATGAGACAGAAATAPSFTLPAPSTSMRISSEPTAITSPTLPPSDSTLPCTGDGISTVALSVMTSARFMSSTTVSPTWTFQATSSTSAMPSPMSGILMT